MLYEVITDTPFIRPETLARMAEERRKGAAVVVLGFEAAVPTGYGRLIVDNGHLEAIIEEKDADASQKSIP